MWVSGTPVEKDETKDFPCNECGCTYKHKSSWYQHKRYECGKEAQFKCKFCGYRGKRKRDIKMHMAIKHNTDVTGRKLRLL